MGGAACPDVIEPGEGGLHIFVLYDEDCVAFAQPGVGREEGLVIVEVCVFEVESQVGVDMEGEVQDG